MNFSFSSSSPFIIKCDGKIKGKISDKEIKSFDLNLGCFIEACFINGDTKNILLDNTLLSNPPPFLSVTDLKGGFIFDFNAYKKSSQFKIIAQEKSETLLISLFNDNGIKLSAETLNGSFSACIEEADSFPFSKAEVNIKRVNGNSFIIIAFYSEKTLIAVYSIQNSLIKEGAFIVDEFNFSEELLLIQKKKDVLLHTVKSVFSFKDGFLPIKTDVIKNKEFSDISEKIIPYAFLEEFAIGKTEESVLSDGIRENADKLKNYLGNFIGIMPPPLWREFDEIGLIKKRAYNLYFVDYVKAEVSGRKITNIKILE